MSELNHPNLLKILDYDLEKKWFVSQFYSKGTLNKNPLFVGEFPRALKAFRPLVEGVSRIHGKKMVHRDIKPQNVFIDHDNNLILGDFGLVFFADEVHTRISDTFENVGSRDWMPGWAYGMKVEDVTPCFDVFSLGKVLWSMISGRPILRLWYVDKEQFNLEKMFPRNKFMSMANRLLKKCVVEEEKDCLLDAKALLEEVDRVLSLVENNAELLDAQIERQCKVCGVGKYTLRIDRDSNQIQNFGIRPTVGNSFKVFTCDHCGHFELFLFEEKKGTPPAWNKKMDLRKKAQIP
jgi:serine/threonine protein kinase